MGKDEKRISDQAEKSSRTYKKQTTLTGQFMESAASSELFNQNPATGLCSNNKRFPYLLFCLPSTSLCPHYLKVRKMKGRTEISFLLSTNSRGRSRCYFRDQPVTFNFASPSAADVQATHTAAITFNSKKFQFSQGFWVYFMVFVLWPSHAQSPLWSVSQCGGNVLCPHKHPWARIIIPNSSFCCFLMTYVLWCMMWNFTPFLIWTILKNEHHFSLKSVEVK